MLHVHDGGYDVNVNIEILSSFTIKFSLQEVEFL